MFFDFEAQAERKTRTSKKTNVFLQQVKKVDIGYLPLRVKNKKTLAGIMPATEFYLSSCISVDHFHSLWNTNNSMPTGYPLVVNIKDNLYLFILLH